MSESNSYYVPHETKWPFLATISLVVLFIGLANYMNGYSSGMVVMLTGFALLFIITYGWFSNVISESESGTYNAQVDISFRWGMVWFIFSEVMFFSAFFGALYYARELSLPWLGGDGAKVSTKLELIKHINEVADHIIVGGGIANTFIKSSGLNVGNSLIEESMLEIAKSILDKGKIILPNRVLTSKTFEGEDIKETSISNIGNDEMILDLYLEQETKTLINNAKTILWNGPMGVFENSLFENGTKELSKEIARSNAFSLAGGGETLSAINKYIKSDDVSYCSTGGGAFLEFMEGKVLPSIKVLNSKENGR